MRCHSVGCGTASQTQSSTQSAFTMLRATRLKRTSTRAISKRGEPIVFDRLLLDVARNRGVEHMGCETVARSKRKIASPAFKSGPRLVGCHRLQGHEPREQCHAR